MAGGVNQIGGGNAAAEFINSQHADAGETIRDARGVEGRQFTNVDVSHEYSALTAPPPPPPPPSQDVRTNSQGSQTAAGWADELKAKLAADPDYQRMTRELELVRLLEGPGGLASIDRQFGGLFGVGTNDGKIDWKNIEAAANDPCAPGHEVAMKLLANPHIFQLIDANADGLITGAEVRAAIDGLKAQMKQTQEDIKASMPPEPKSEPSAGNGTPPKDGTAPQGSNDAKDPKAAAEQAAAELKKKMEPDYPFSTDATDSQGKIDDASKYLTDWTDKLQEEMVKAAAAGDTATVTAIQAKLSKLQMCQQALQQLQQQMFTMMSNMLKMYGDMASTAINNMR